MVKTMKKTYIILLLVAALAVLIPTLVFAEEAIDDDYSDDEYIESVDENVDEFFDEETPDVELNECVPEGKYLKVRGKWGNAGDREFDGYFGGRIAVITLENGKHIGVFKGLYNKTGEEEKGRIVGIMKKGYFNGKIISDEGDTKVTGLYKIDRENNLLKMQWMIPYHAGWAVARIQLEES